MIYLPEDFLNDSFVIGTVIHALMRTKTIRARILSIRVKKGAFTMLTPEYLNAQNTLNMPTSVNEFFETRRTGNRRKPPRISTVLGSRISTVPSIIAATARQGHHPVSLVVVPLCPRRQSKHDVPV